MSKLFIKKPWVSIILIIIIIGIAIGYKYWNSAKKSPYDFISAKRGNLVQEVSVTGKVKPSENIDLAFEKTGRVTKVNAKVGDRIARNEILMQLDKSELEAQLLEAEASVKSEEARLEELKRGTRKEELDVQETKIRNTKISLEDAKKTIIDVVEDSITKSDDAIRNKVDKFFQNSRTSNPQLLFSVSDSQLKTDVEWGRIVMENLLTEWKSSFNSASNKDDLISDAEKAKNNLTQIKSFLDKTALAVNGLTAGQNLSITTVDSWKSDVSIARTNINTAISNLSTAEEKLRSSESSINLSEQELALKLAGTPKEQITAQEAKLDQVKANVKNIQAQIKKTTLNSPINGIVTKIDAKVGEIVSANIKILSLISDAAFEIEANVPEADIAKIKIGDTASVTLDAYGSDIVFTATIAKIDPAETIIDGMSTYKTTFQFKEEDGRIKSGMTANIDVMTDKRENVIMVPQRTIIEKDGEKMIKVATKSSNPKEEYSISEVRIKVGLRGSDGNVEIIEGLNENDKVVVSSKED